METIDSQIKIVQQKMITLAQTHVQLLTARNQLVPLHRLPTEILSEIFTLYCCSNEKEIIQNSLPLQDVLCQVCSRWRRIAHSLPRLWTELTIAMVHGQFPHHVSMGQEWLQRSGSLPVGITFDVQEDDDRSDSGDTGRRSTAHLPVPRRIVQDCVRPFLHRCTYLVLRLRVDDLMDLFDLPAIHAPHLKTLSLQLADPVDGPKYSVHVSLHNGDVVTFNDCPNLINIYVGTDYHLLPVLECMSTIKVPSALELTLEADLARDACAYRNMLIACNPKECTMSMSGNDIYLSSDVLGSIVTLDQLSLLKVELIGLARLSFLVGELRLPSLKTLSIDYPSKFNSWAQEEIWGQYLRDLQLRSSFSLTSFTLCNSPPTRHSTGELLEFLQLVPSLESLCLIKCNISIYSLANALVLKHDGSRPTILPNLHSFHFEDRAEFFPNEEEDGFIAEMVLSRWWKEQGHQRFGVSCLNTVNIRIIGREFEESLLEPMRMCRKYGTQIILESEVVYTVKKYLQG